MRRGIAVGLVWGLLATPGHAAETTYRLGLPYFVDPGVGGLFPGGQRLGGGAELKLSGPWSLSWETQLLHQDWGSTRYTLSLTPVMIRHRLPLGRWSDSPFLTIGAGGAAMTLAGGNEGFRFGLGPAFAAGIGLPFGSGFLAQVELQQGAIHSIHYVGLGMSLGMRVGAPTRRMRTSEPVAWGTHRAPQAPPLAAPQVALKPPLPQGQLIQVGRVSDVQGERIRFAIDDLPYRVLSGDILVVYYLDQVPIKVAKIRVETVDQDGRAATGNLVAATEAIRRGYLLGTL